MLLNCVIRVYKCYILTCFIHTCTCVSPWWWTLARRAESANAEPLRESVDFSDLLENSDEREEDRKKKLVSLFNVTVHACIVHVHVHEYSAQLMLECFAVHDICNCFILVSYYTLSLLFLSLPPSPSSPSPSSPSLSFCLPSLHPLPPRSSLLSSVLEKGTPFSQWDSSTIVAWLEVWVVVPFWYIAAIRSCLQSGEMLAVSV